MSTFEYRQAKQDAHCRDCDREIKRGEYMISGWSFRNRGQNIHFCPECIVYMANLIPPEKMVEIGLKLSKELTEYEEAE